jgi:hypothetical protein
MWLLPLMLVEDTGLLAPAMVVFAVLALFLIGFVAALRGVRPSRPGDPAPLGTTSRRSTRLVMPAFILGRWGR